MTPALERVPREFARNRFLGLYAALEVFQEALGRHDEPACSDLLNELSDGGYPSWPAKDDLLVELHDVALVRHQGLDGLLDHYEGLRLRATSPGDPVAHRGLGLVFQATGYLDVAQDHYERSVRLWDDTGDPRVQEVRDLLVTLGHQRHRGERHPFFIQRWAAIEEGRVDARRKLREVVIAALADPDWRLGREAVAALEQLGDWQALEQVLGSSTPSVEIAALAALRRHGARLHEATLVAALGSASPAVRWQAALLLGTASPGAVRPLIERLRQDTAAPAVRTAAAESLGRLAGTSPQRGRAEAALRERLGDADPNVQVAAAMALGAVGDRQTLPALRPRLPNVTDFRGRSLTEALHKAAAQIEHRFPPSAPPRSAAPARTPAPPRPAPTSAPVVPPWMQADTRNYARRALALQILHVGLGAAVIGMVDLGMAIGYLLYAAVARWLVEPFVAPFDFFADKPCHAGTGRPAQRPGSGWLRSRLRTAFVYLPLSLVPFLAYLLLVARGSAPLSTLGMVLPLLHGVLWSGRTFYLKTAACPSCRAQSSCPVWQRTLPL
jgi:hypothetical protein